jgi:hypothetical protein
MSQVAVDMTFAQVFTVRGGKQTRMEMYADQAEALEATGLSGGRRPLTHVGLTGRPSEARNDHRRCARRTR